jgi:hypothetical protein
LIEKNRDRSLVLDASNKFYSIIPHYHISILNNKQVIKEKLDMLDSLTEIEAAYNLIKAEHENRTDLTEQDPIDFHYKQLQCEIDVLPKSKAFY